MVTVYSRQFISNIGVVTEVTEVTVFWGYPPYRIFLGREMAIREWIKKDDEQKEFLKVSRSKKELQIELIDLEEIMTAIIDRVRDEIQSGGRWSFSPEVRIAEDEITRTYEDVLAGRCKIEDFRAACVRWKAVIVG